MYRATLSESCFPAQDELPVLETTVGGILREQAARTPDAVALIEVGLTGRISKRWTYSELLADSERLARSLLSRFEPGERICVWAPNAPEWVILEYAAAIAGLILVTANPGYQERELRFIIEQSRAVGLFLVREHRGNPMAAIAAAAVAGNLQMRSIIDLEDPDALYAGEECNREFPAVSARDAVQIQYTSGTTGFPKGAILSHRGITNNSRFHFALSGIRNGETVLNFMPLFHTASCGLLVLGCAQFGCTMVLARIFEADAMLDVIESQRVDALIGVPTMLVAVMEAQMRQPRRLNSVRTVVSGGAVVPFELMLQVRESFGWNILTVYGQTESSPLLTQIRPGDPIELAMTTVGRPYPNTEISIRDVATNDVAPLGTVGEICARGYGVMIGYNDDPQATASAIDRDGWLHTGDLGTIDERGFVAVAGRLKDMIIRGGENLFPAEIEGVILEHETVAESAVVGMSDDRWGEVVVAFVRLSNGSAFDEAALAAHCRQRMAAQKLPARWIVVKDWPLTGPGKIQKYVLRERLEAGYYEAVTQ